MLPSGKMDILAEQIKRIRMNMFSTRLQSVYIVFRIDHRKTSIIHEIFHFAITKNNNEIISIGTSHKHT